ncbi:MAG: tRNA preQ1(34) S-adenosylmethionine ribosyltransferase-isomerase QueA [Candidatus Syntrophonatronum acetioxidans]|uniref:S-adenosylmethionine:tRNA ribosyltransferase-isomerase n=1 Tax=Candidatus Syntrophonatronum acetioxidans TaxID=1795816 RepID=A0A424YHB0_9FIRM|nr:MAG: tRNA preQ1(34) S-adenosylmethionine ribosyltransferase-isomerase QueA [Candidatus Syntrophonatronum acetioxidans]
MELSEFDYYLPPELIAQEPVPERSGSRLLVAKRDKGIIEHTWFQEIIEYLVPGDTLVLNDTRVIPARLFGVRKDTGGKVEIILLKRRQENRWEVLVKPGKRARPGIEIVFGDGKLTARVEDYTEEGGRVLSFHYQGVFEEVLSELGEMPLPPYIKKKLEEPERYQTVYAREEGSAAAPTAGLHFTPELLKKIKEKGVELIYLTLHVGLATFRPVKVDRIEEHKMHEEYYQVSPSAAHALNKALAAGSRIIAVGTTSCRVLETIRREEGFIPGKGWTDIFIYPGYQFKAVDGLLTNFHLPRSTLIMLVCAFGGKDLVMKAYQEAMERRYRFYSFGDAMLIL